MGMHVHVCVCVVGDICHAIGECLVCVCCVVIIHVHTTHAEVCLWSVTSP